MTPWIDPMTQSSLLQPTARVTARETACICTARESICFVSGRDFSRGHCFLLRFVFPFGFRSCASIRNLRCGRNSRRATLWIPQRWIFLVMTSVIAAATRQNYMLLIFLNSQRAHFHTMNVATDKRPSAAWTLWAQMFNHVRGRNKSA